MSIRDLAFTCYCPYMHRYQLFINDILENSTDSFENEWKLNLHESTGKPELVIGGDNEIAPYFIGCMKNLAIQFKLVLTKSVYR